MPTWCDCSPTHTTRAWARWTRRCSRITSPGRKRCPAEWRRAPVGETSRVQTWAVRPEFRKFTLRGIATGRRSSRNLWKCSSFNSEDSSLNGRWVTLTSRIVAPFFVQNHSGNLLSRMDRENPKDDCVIVWRTYALIVETRHAASLRGDCHWKGSSGLAAAYSLGILRRAQALLRMTIAKISSDGADEGVRVHTTENPSPHRPELKRCTVREARCLHRRAANHLGVR